MNRLFPQFVIAHKLNPVDHTQHLYNSAEMICNQINAQAAAQEQAAREHGPPGANFDTPQFLRNCIAAMPAVMVNDLQPFILVVLELDHYEALVRGEAANA